MHIKNILLYPFIREKSLYFKISFIVIMAGIFIFAGSALAESSSTVIDNVGIEAISADIASSTAAADPVEIKTILSPKNKKDMIFSAFGNSFRLTIPEVSVLSASSTLEITLINDQMSLPWRLDKLSKIYQFQIKPDAALTLKKPLEIQLPYELASNDLKKIYYFDKAKSAWQSLPSRDNPDKKTITAKISLPFARLAVFSDPDYLAIGSASWYKFKTGNYAASPDFPKGSKLRVYNLSNGKFVDVVINDFGPERNKFPNRVVDLEKTAFQKISSARSGIIKVRIDYLGEVVNKKLTAGPEKTESTNIDIKSRSAIVVNEQTGDVLFDKNSLSTQPLASLSKLVAIKVFIDTRPTLSQVVSYSSQDEKYNFAQVDHPYEAATVKLKDGETLTIEDLLYSALVGSANNAVESLVRVSGMTRNDFIQKMNQTVADWGATSTSFQEPTGLSPKNVSSTHDYAIITREVYKNPIIQKASTMQKYVFSTINTKKKHAIKNTNSIIEMNKFQITGSKTGFLNESGYCLMTRARAKNGQQIIVVTFGAASRIDSVSSTKKLLDYGLLKVNG